MIHGKPHTAKHVMAILIPAFLLCAFVRSPSYSSTPESMNRAVMGLYNSSERKYNYDFNSDLHRRVEMVINRLGLVMELHDVARGLPSDREMKGYDSIIVYFASNKMNNAAKYWKWLERQLRSGKRVVMLDGIGPETDTRFGPVDKKIINATLSLMGIRAGFEYSDQPLDIAVAFKDSSVVEFERKLIGDLTTFTEIHSTGKSNKVFLRLRLKSSGILSDSVILTPNGGFVADGYLTHTQEKTDITKWRIDPFFFFSRALGVDHTPRPDVTTRNGARVFYSHIDGDGITSRTRFDQKRSTGDVLYTEIFHRESWAPFSVSVIVAEMMPRLKGNANAINMAKKIFRLPNVEPASHTFSHPLVWDRALVTSVDIDNYADIGITKETFSNEAVLPWVIAGYSFDPKKETVGAIDFINRNLSPPNRKARLLQWSGNCLPPRSTIKLAQDAGILNINGGDLRFDATYPSYIYVAPLFRKAGNYIQVYSSASNENLYTNNWTGLFGGFVNVINTYKRTESPIRVAPVNLYFHFYSGERLESLNALKKILKWVKTQNAFPMFTTEYVESVLDFANMKITPIGTAQWIVENSGDCRTIRFDNYSAATIVDMEKSSGVLGYKYEKKSLYVHLDEHYRHRIVLTRRKTRRIPYLSFATSDVHGFGRDRDSLTYSTRSFGKALHKWRGLRASHGYIITCRRSSQTTRKTVNTSAGGELAFSIESNTENVIVSITPKIAATVK